MPDTFQLEIVTPEKMVVRDVAEEMQIPGKKGYLGILPGHAPLITELAVGEITYRASGTITLPRQSPGDLPRCCPTKSPSSPKPANARTKSTRSGRSKPKQRAEQRLKSGSTEVDYQRAEDALQRAETRLEVAAKK